MPIPLIPNPIPAAFQKINAKIAKTEKKVDKQLAKAEAVVRKAKIMNAILNNLPPLSNLEYTIFRTVALKKQFAGIHSFQGAMASLTSTLSLVQSTTGNAKVASVTGSLRQSIAGITSLTNTVQNAPNMTKAQVQQLHSLVTNLSMTKSLQSEINGIIGFPTNVINTLNADIRLINSITRQFTSTMRALKRLSRPSGARYKRQQLITVGGLLKILKVPRIPGLRF